MTNVQLPGVNPFLHEATISGRFDLRVSDFQQVTFQGRVMMVLVADIGAVEVKDKKGDQVAFWKLKGVDAAFLRDEALKNFLAGHLDLEPADGSLFDEDDDIVRGPKLMGVYGEEGEFLGFEKEEEERDEEEEVQAAIEEAHEEVVIAEAHLEVNHVADEDDVFRPGEANHPRHRGGDSTLERFLSGEDRAGISV